MGNLGGFGECIVCNSFDLHKGVVREDGCRYAGPLMGQNWKWTIVAPVIEINTRSAATPEGPKGS